MEVSESLLCLPSPFWNHQDAEILLKEHLDSLLYKNAGVTCHCSTRPCSHPLHIMGLCACSETESMLSWLEQGADNIKGMDLCPV